MRPSAGEHRRGDPGKRRRHSPSCSGPSSPPCPCRRGCSSYSHTTRSPATRATIAPRASPKPKVGTLTSRAPADPAPQVARVGGSCGGIGGDSRSCSHTRVASLRVRCCCVESRRPPHCASCTVGSRSLSARRRAYSSVSTAPREPGAVRARPRSARRVCHPRSTTFVLVRGSCGCRRCGTGSAASGACWDELRSRLRPRSSPRSTPGSC